MKKFTKEELMNTYIVNDHGKLREKYINACLEVGIGHQSDVLVVSYYNLKHIGCTLEWYKEDKTIGQSDWRIGGTQLKLEDFEEEPITSQWKYELIGDTSIFDLHKDLKAGNLYFQDHNQGNSDGMVQITDEGTLITLIAGQDTICRKVEVKWQDEVAGISGFAVENGCIYTDRWISETVFLEAARIALRGVGEEK